MRRQGRTRDAAVIVCARNVAAKLEQRAKMDWVAVALSMTAASISENFIVFSSKTNIIQNEIDTNSILMKLAEVNLAQIAIERGASVASAAFYHRICPRSHGNLSLFCCSRCIGLRLCFVSYTLCIITSEMLSSSDTHDLQLTKCKTITSL